MFNSDLRKKISEFSVKKKLDIAERLSLINEAFPNDFNYSIGEGAVLKKFGRYLPISDKWSFSIFQPCVRFNDFFKRREKDTSFYLALFEMVDIGGIYLSNKRKDSLFLRENSIKNTYYFLVDELGLDKEKIYINYFSGNTLKELTDGRVLSSRCLEPDLETMNIWQSLGLPKNRFIPDATSRTFVLNFSPFEFYAGYRSEIFVKIEGVEELVEVGTFQFFDFQTKLNEFNQISDVVPMDGFFGGSAIGVERTLCAINRFRDIYLCDHIAPLYEMVLKMSAKNELLQARYLSEALRLMHMIIADGGSLAGGVHEKRRYKLRKIIKIASASAEILKLDLEKNLPHLLIKNAEINPWYPELKENINRISIVFRHLTKSF